MCPIPLDVFEQSCKQVEDLFEQFLRVDSQVEDFLPKRQSREHNEVEYQAFARGGLQRDSAKRLSSGNEYAVKRFSGGTDFSPDSLREVNLVAKSPSPTAEKRRSHGSPRPGAPASSPPTSSPSIGQESVEQMEVDTDKKKQFSECRPRAQSQGPTEQQLHDAALTIAAVGDQINRDYGEKMDSLKSELIEFLANAERTLTYEMFAVHVGDLIGTDRSWTNFMFMMHLSRRVIIETKNVGRTASTYFRRFLGQAFAEEISAQKNVVEYVCDKTKSEASTV